MENTMWPPPGGIEGNAREEVVVRHCGYPIEETRAARESAVVVQMTWLRIVNASGRDVREYLHRRVSNATKSLRPGEGRRAFVLDAVGRTMADTEILCRAEDDLVVLAPSYRGDSLVSELGKYVFGELAAFESDNELVALGVIGPRAQAALEAADLPVPETPHGLSSLGPPGRDRIAVVRSDFALGDFVVLAPRQWALATWQSLVADTRGIGVRAAGWTAWETLRILRLIPLYGAEFDESTTPLDASLRHGLDRDKGCYPGQEAMARTMNLGHPARAIVQVRIDSGPAEPPLRSAMTTGNGTSAGLLTSVIPTEAAGPSLALASVAWGCRFLETRLIVETSEGPGEVTVVAKAEE